MKMYERKLNEDELFHSDRWWFLQQLLLRCCHFFLCRDIRWMRKEWMKTLNGTHKRFIAYSWRYQWHLSKTRWNWRWCEQTTNMNLSDANYGEEIAYNRNTIIFYRSHYQLRLELECLSFKERRKDEADWQWNA